MNLTVARRAVDYLFKLCVRESDKPEQIPYYPQKTRSMLEQTPPTMPRLTAPETVGVSSAYLEEFLHALENDRDSTMHNLLVYRESKLICAASAPGYSPRVWSLTHSMAKTVTAFAIAILIEDGLLTLDTRLTHIFSDELPTLVSTRMRQVTIRHLLSMTAGVTDVSEAASVTLTNWKHAFLASIPSFAPGKKFFYNSMNSYMLAATVEKISGKSLEDFLNERLFAPLGIRTYYLEKSPEGIAKGGWGMYLTPVDMGKLGQLVLQGGIWEGKPILSASYLSEATRVQAQTTEKYGDYNYGYHIWVARDGSSVLFNGMLGQNIWVSPRVQMVVVSTAGNEEFFQISSTLRIIAHYFGEAYMPAQNLFPNLIAMKKLRRAEQDFFCRRMKLPECGKHEDCYSRRRTPPLPKRATEILGDYRVEKNNVGLLPLLLRAIQNNHSTGIDRLRFSIRDKRFYIHVKEGAYEYVFEGGFGMFCYTELDFKGEKYLVGALCAFLENEDGDELFKIDIIFPEIPHSRRIKFYFHAKKRTVVSFSEKPGVEMIDAALSSLAANNAMNSTIVDFVRKQMSSDLLFARVLRCMEPVLYASPRGDTEEKALLQETKDHVLRRVHNSGIIEQKKE